MPSISFISYFNPSSAQHRAVEKFHAKDEKTGAHIIPLGTRIGICIAAALLSLITFVVGGIALFSYLVNRVTKELTPQQQATAGKVTAVATPPPSTTTASSTSPSPQKQKPHQPTPVPHSSTTAISTTPPPTNQEVNKSTPPSQLIDTPDGMKSWTMAKFWLTLRVATRHIDEKHPVFQPQQIKHNFHTIDCRTETAEQVIVSKDNITSLHANRIGHYSDSSPQLIEASNDIKVRPLPFHHASIAMQAPWAHAGLYLPYFLQTKASIILDLTRPGEKIYNDSYNSTDCYPPTTKQAIVDISNQHEISCSQVTEKAPFTHFSYTVQHTSHRQQQQRLTRLHFPNWQDFSTTTPADLKALIEAFEAHLEESGATTPPIIHCRAGVGRTGTFIVARELLYLHKQGLLTENNYDLTVMRLIIQGRRERSSSFVQQRTQAQFLRDFAKYLLEIP